MGWAMLFVGLVAPVLVGWWLVGRRGADIWLSLLALVSLPMLVWAASLGAEIGTCDVPDCMSSTQHSHLVLGLPGLGLLLLAYALMAARQTLIGGLALIVAQIFAVLAVRGTDTATLVMFLGLIAVELAYLVYLYVGRRRPQVPDYPPAA